MLRFSLPRRLPPPSPGHEAVWAWDLGNENSNCVVPPSQRHRPAPGSRASVGDPRRRRDGARHGRVAHGRPRRGSAARAARSLRGVRSPLDARLPDLRALGGRSDRRSAAPVPGPRDPLARGRSRRPVQRVRSPDLPPWRSARAERRRDASGRRGSGGCVHDRGPGGASSRRLPRRNALVLLRLRPGALGEPALRSRSPRAHVRALASRRLTETGGRCHHSVRRRRTVHRRDDADAWIDIDRDEFLLDPSAQLPRLYRRYREQSRPNDARSAFGYVSRGAARTASRRSRSRAVARQMELSAAP